MQQRDLFGNTIEEVKTVITFPWSHSRIGSLNSCPRKYFYQYYASKKRSAKNILGKDRIVFLSHLATKHLIIGTIIHDAIDNYFKRYKSGVNYDLSMILNWAFEKLEAVYVLTEKARNNSTIQFVNGDKIFKELYYRIVDPEKFKAEVKEKIETNLINFYEAEEFKEFRRGGKLKSSDLEKWLIFKLMGYASIKGKMDLGYETSTGDYYVVDWKTGGVENEDTSLQLLMYAIWGIETGAIDSNRVKLFKAYLQENKVEPLEFSDEHILRAKMRVIQDTQTIEKLHKYGIEGVENAFSKIDFPNKICPQCPFEELCHKTIANGNKY